MSKAKLLVLALGQDLRGDDGAGPEVLKRWREAYPETAGRQDLLAEVTPLPGLTLLSLLEYAHNAILVDAAQSGAPAGSLHVLQAEDLAGFGLGAGSAHDWGIAETLALGASIDPDKLPEHLTILAIEAKDLELGHAFSAEVQAALPQAVQKLQELGAG